MVCPQVCESAVLNGLLFMLLISCYRRYFGPLAPDPAARVALAVALLGPMPGCASRLRQAVVAASQTLPPASSRTPPARRVHVWAPRPTMHLLPTDLSHRSCHDRAAADRRSPRLRGSTGAGRDWLHRRGCVANGRIAERSTERDWPSKAAER